MDNTVADMYVDSLGTGRRSTIMNDMTAAACAIGANIDVVSAIVRYVYAVADAVNGLTAACPDSIQYSKRVRAKKNVVSE